MRVYVPSRGRFQTYRMFKHTLKYLSAAARARTVYVCHPSEREQYARALDGGGVSQVVSVEYDTIDQKRLAIGQLAARLGENKFCMMDDDLEMMERVAPDKVNQKTIQKSARTDEMLADLEHLLDAYVSVGVSAREANGLDKSTAMPRPAVRESERLMRVAAFQTEAFLSVEHCRVPVMEDHDVQLQLLRRGLPNAVSYWWSAGNDEKTGYSGGCATWRTLELHNAAAQRLADLHPGLVRLREKKNKTDADGFGSRTEVTISWKKALGKDL